MPEPTLAALPRPSGSGNMRWYNAVWRWHFYAGMFCIPFVIWLALTGTVYLWKPQVEAIIDRPYDHLAVSGPAALPGDQVRTALSAVPGSSLSKYVLPQSPNQAVRILVSAGGETRRVYVDPHTLAILKVEAENDRPFNLIMRLHGELLIGKTGSVVVEIAACWAIIMLLTGLYLWWPRSSRGFAGVLYPRLRRGRRLFWRDLHAVAGIWVSVFALGLILTGLPWAAAWGSYFEEVRSLTGTISGPVDWTIGGKAPSPKQDPILGVHAEHEGMSAMAPTSSPDELSRVISAILPLRIAPPVLLSPPPQPGDTWRAASDAADRPMRSEAEVDGKSGQLRGRTGFRDRHPVDRAIGYGIAAHEGALFGLMNQLLGSLTALLLVVLAVSGAVLWWRRRPTGLLGAPVGRSRPRYGGLLIGAVAPLAILMPLFGLTLLALLVVEATVLRRMPGASAWLGLRTPARDCVE